MIILEQLIFNILAFTLFVITFLKIVKRNDTTYVIALILEAIGIAINFIEIIKNESLPIFLKVIVPFIAGLGTFLIGCKLLSDNIEMLANNKIKDICLLGDGASWIKNGVNELRLYSTNHTKFYLCEFHFKQAIHHITSDKEKREHLVEIFNNNSKKAFKNAVNEIILDEPKRKDTITKKLNYIINNYTSIKSMLELNIGSSMESHISHLIASLFSSRPKGFSTKRITKYLKLNDYKNNNINIFKLYMQSYKNTEEVIINQNKLDYSLFETNSDRNIPILNEGIVSPIYQELNTLAHY